MSFEDEIKNKKTLIEAHRGVSDEEEQNTNEAFKKAIEYKIDSFETDTWLTKDDVLVLVHDGNKLRSQYNKGGDVRELTWEELKEYRTKKTNSPMPRLDEVMSYTKGKIFMNLEIKDFRIEKVWPKIVELIEKYEYYNQISISSFEEGHGYYDKIIEYNKKFNKKIMFGFLYKPLIGKTIDFKKPGHRINVHIFSFSEEFAKEAHKNNMYVGVFFFNLFGLTDCLFSFKNLMKKGADIIITDHPRIAELERNEYYSKDT